MFKNLQRGWGQIKQLRDAHMRQGMRLSWRDIKIGDVIRSIRAGGNMQERLRALFGWALIGIGIVGLVLPIIPGAFLIVIGAALTGWRHPMVEKMAEPMFRLSDALPEDKIPSSLRPLWMSWRQLGERHTKNQTIGS